MNYPKSKLTDYDLAQKLKELLDTVPMVEHQRDTIKEAAERLVSHHYANT